MMFDEKFIDTYCLPFLNEIPRVTWKLGVHRGKKVCKESDDSLLVKFITLYSYILVIFVRLKKLGRYISFNIYI